MNKNNIAFYPYLIGHTAYGLISLRYFLLWLECKIISLLTKVIPIILTVIELLIQAFKEIASQNIKLLIVGEASDNSYAKNIRKLCNGNPNIILHTLNLYPFCIPLL